MGNALDTLGMNMNMAQMVSQQPAQQQFRQPEMPSGDLFSCLWDDCFPTLSDPAAAQGHNHAHAHPHPHPHVKSDAPLTPETMLRHLLQEHLGVPLSNGEVKPHDAHHAHPHPHTHNCDHAAKAESHPAPHSHHHEHAHPHRDHHHHVGPRHKRQYPMACQWPGCTVQEPFTSSAELMEHLSEVHVGRGQDKYACHWGQCGSGQGRMFSSRQKVLRHLQSHIGHRPFVCSVCGQGFSEAAPLAAHMRRHTDDSEYGPRLASLGPVAASLTSEPFVCDHPGCGKAFAIASSLTIHKRTHNGDKPFVCSYCGKGFAEASNLTKHIRTHTGERPFKCSHPGCNKRFARPDQLKRHQGVHLAKEMRVASTVSGEVKSRA